MFLGLHLGLDDVLMEEFVGVTACVIGDMGCLRFCLRVWDTLKEEDEGWSEEKKNGGTWVSKTWDLHVIFFPHRMPSLGSPLGSWVLKTQVLIDLEFLKLKMLVFQFVLQPDN